MTPASSPSQRSPASRTATPATAADRSAACTTGERFLLDWFKAEAFDADYRMGSADTPEPVADIETLPEQCHVCMLRSGIQFRCDDLDTAEQRIAACHRLGL